MSDTILIVRKGRRYIPIRVDADANSVDATLSKRAAKLTGCSGAFVNGTGERAVRELLRKDLESFDSITALRESFEFDSVSFKRAAGYDVR